MTIYQKQLLIERRDLVKWPEKVTTTGFTLLFWGAFMYMLQPLIGLVAWAFNFAQFQLVMLELGGLEGFLEEAGFHLQLYGFFCGSLLIWAKINEFRFKNVERRKSVGSADRQRLCETFGVSAEDLDYWIEQRNVDCIVDPDTGRVRFLQQDPH